MDSWLKELKGKLLLPALAMILIGLFGLRDIAVTPIILRLFGSIKIRPFLPLLYAIIFVLGAVLLVVHLYQTRRQWRGAYTDVRRNSRSALVWFTASLPFFHLLATRRLETDFWLDEVISINRHIQPSLGSSLFWYPAPNNHIFSNAFTNIYIQLLDARTLYVLFEQPLILRGLYFFFSIGTILLIGLFAERAIGKHGGIFAVVLLTTSIPFLNYAVMVRGYAPTLFFFTLLLHLLYSYRQRADSRSALGIVFLSAALFYTIPSNLYILASAALYSAFKGARNYILVPEKRFEWSPQSFLVFNKEMTPAILIGAGVLIGTVFYLPVVQQVIDNKFVTSEGLFQGTVFVDAFPRTIEYFISGRMIPVGAAVAGLGMFWWRNRNQGQGGGKDLLLWLLVLFFMPFLLSFVRGDDPFERTFLVGLPVFSLLGAFGWFVLLQQWSRWFGGKNLWVYVFLAVFVLGINGLFLWRYSEIENEIYTNLVEEKIDAIEYYDNTLRASHHLDHYQVRQVIETVNRGLSEGLKIYLDENDTRFPWVLEVYFEAYDIPYQTISGLEEIATENGLVVVAYPGRSLAEFRAVNPEVDCELLSGDVSLYRVMFCRFR